MKFQYLAVIFVIITLPIALVLSFYIQTQIDTVKLQTDYTAKLNAATYDAVKSFQINTTNSYYSSVSDSKIRDIEASVNSFYNSLTTSLKYSKKELEAYVPAIVYTLYDGYYIYGRRYNVLPESSLTRKGGDDEETKDELIKMDIITNTEGIVDSENYEYGLKPFVYYSCRYKSGSDDFVINFTLDNFISIYGKIKGEYVTESGYLVNLNDCKLEEINGVMQVTEYKGVEIEEREILTEYLRFSDTTSQGEEDLEEQETNNQNTNTQKKYTSKDNGEYEYIVYQNQKIYMKKNSNGDVIDCFWYDKGTAKIVNTKSIKDAVTIEYANGVRKSKGTTSGREYYTKAYNFSKWVDSKIGNISQANIIDGEKLSFNAGKSKLFEMNSQDPENPASNFNEHRIAVIKRAIETNLIAAINSYNSNAGSYAYALPQMTAEEWDKVVNNVCVVAFMQGLPIAGKYFNNYTVVPNDKNNEFVDTDAVYMLTNDKQYHMPNCPLLVENASNQGKIIGGYINTSFERQTLDEKYYYKHNVIENKNVIPYTACYRCIVNPSMAYELDDILNNENNRILNGNKSYDITLLRKKYITILSRERYDLYKTNN